MIPKFIHQTAKTAELDERSARLQAIVRKLHPDWTYKLWTDADNDAFVRAEYPAFYPVFAGFPKNIMRADVIRYLLMDKLGGLYLDTDYEMLRPFDWLDHTAVVAWESDDDRGPNTRQLGNALFAATPGHVYFRRLIEALAAHGPPPPDADVLSTTGPAFITAVYRAMPADEQAQVTLAPRAVFNPPMWNSRDYQALVNDPTVYGIHHCYGSWRQYSLAQRIRNRIGRIYRQWY